VDNKSKWTIHLTFSALIAPFALFLIFMAILPHFGATLYIGFDDPKVLVLISVSIIIVLCSSWIILWLYFRANHSVVKTILVSILIIILLSTLFYTAVAYVFRMDVEYQTRSSPDGNYQIVIKLESFLVHSSCTVYERISPLIVKELGHFQCDGFDTLEVTWDDSQCIISCGSYCVQYNLLQEE